MLPPQARMPPLRATSDTPEGAAPRMTSSSGEAIVSPRSHSLLGVDDDPRHADARVVRAAPGLDRVVDERAGERYDAVRPGREALGRALAADRDHGVARLHRGEVAVEPVERCHPPLAAAVGRDRSGDHQRVGLAARDVEVEAPARHLLVGREDRAAHVEQARLQAVAGRVDARDERRIVARDVDRAGREQPAAVRGQATGVGVRPARLERQLAVVRERVVVVAVRLERAQPRGVARLDEHDRAAAAPRDVDAGVVAEPSEHHDAFVAEPVGGRAVGLAHRDERVVVGHRLGPAGQRDPAVVVDRHPRREVISRQYLVDLEDLDAVAVAERRVGIAVRQQPDEHQVVAGAGRGGAEDPEPVVRQHGDRRAEVALARRDRQRQRAVAGERVVAVAVAAPRHDGHVAVGRLSALADRVVAVELAVDRRTVSTVRARVVGHDREVVLDDAGEREVRVDRDARRERLAGGGRRRDQRRGGGERRQETGGSHRILSTWETLPSS